MSEKIPLNKSDPPFAGDFYFQSRLPRQCLHLYPISIKVKSELLEIYEAIMDLPNIPDLSKWTENIANRTAVVDNGNPIGFAKFFFRFDMKNPDKRIHKLMQQCMIFYAFNVEVVVKEWIVYDEVGNGEFRKILFSAILLDRVNDKWAVGLPNQNWVPEVSYSGGKISGITISLKTNDGLKSVYVKNPEYKK